MGNTVEQDQCIACMTGPMDISAGAGSGKTYTLTQRIAYALSTPESGVDDIDQILAITFTHAAAAELKGRVRATLREKGLFDQAQKVDGAWISTIHGMCSRILRSCALEVGIDPEFKLVEGIEDDRIFEQSVNDILNLHEAQLEVGELDDDPYRELFENLGLQSGGKGSGLTVFGLVSALIGAAQELPDGWDGLHVVLYADDVHVIARELLVLCEEELAFFTRPNATDTQKDNCDKAQAGIDAANAFFERGGSDVFELVKLVDGVGKMGKRVSKAEKETVESFNERLADLSRRAAMMRDSLLLSQAVGLAKEVDAHYSENKKNLGVLTNNDLIKLALKALDIPEVAARYTRKFRLVMVDEFQDTDSLQLAIIRRLAGEDLRYLCTVGDAQQSIYAFRGADVETYRAYRRSLLARVGDATEDEPQMLQLTSNFRSHGDVLAFVKKVCERDEVFGDGFLDLKVGREEFAYHGSDPRVQVIVSAVAGKGVHKGAIDDAREETATQIVQYFRSLKEAGHSLSDMALLLGRMDRAPLYAERLRAAGFECIIAKGSFFANSLEAKLVAQLARAVANPCDTEALFNVLAGPLFGLSSDELLVLASKKHEWEETFSSRSLDEGFATVMGYFSSEEGADDSADESALKAAARVLGAAQEALSWQSLSGVLRDVLRNCGFFARQQARGAEGTACIANFLKALRMIEKLEAEPGAGPATIARLFAASIDAGIKETPGALNVKDQEAIKISTIHGAKGLQYPLVAIADFSRNPSAGPFLKKRAGEESYVGILSSGVAAGDEGGAFDLESFKVASPRQQLNAMYQAALRADAQERQRLFYVAATRAEEAVGVFLAVKESDKQADAYKNTEGDVVQALFEDGIVPEGDTLVDCGSSEPVLVRKVWVPVAAEEPDGTPGGDAADVSDEPAVPAESDAPAEADAQQFTVYELDGAKLLDAHRWNVKTPGLFSYTSISDEKPSTVGGHAKLSVVETDDEGEVEDATALFGRRMADADKAASFGSAFHRLAQLSLERSADYARAQSAAVMQTYEVKDKRRMLAAFERWTDSLAFARAKAAQVVLPELPFTVKLPGTDEALEGAIDALCIETLPDGGRAAFVIDYKTGGAPEESPEHLHEKHELQAMCYAYALLKQGFAQVELSFLRVEQEPRGGNDSLQTVNYMFSTDDFEELEQAILLAWSSAKAHRCS